MKPISRILIVAGTGILFLLCIIIGVLYYRNLNRNEEEMAVSIERNLKQYLNERVNSLEPQVLEKEMDSEQIKQIIDYLVNEEYKSDWWSQWLKEAENTFVTREEYSVIGEGLLAALRAELMNQLETKLAEIATLLEKMETEDGKLRERVTVLETGLQNMQKLLAKMEEIIKKMESENSGLKTEIQNINAAITNIQNELKALKVNSNVKVEKKDADTAILYLVPVN